jgi:hypothetical protein
MMEAREIAYLKIGGVRRLRVEDLQEFLARHMQAPAA